MPKNKRIFKLLFLLLGCFALVKTNAQDFSDAWTGHFSYLDIKDVTQGTTKVIGAAENAVFIYDKNTNEIETISTVNGLSGETISAIHYLEERELIIVGFENGLVQIYDEFESTVLSVVDILEKQTIPPSTKKINHFNLIEDLIYISTDYGISVYNINSFEFGDTYYIGVNGAQVVVSQTTVLNGFIYAATTVGVKKGLLTNPNLIDYQEWEQLVGINSVGIEAVGDRLFIARSNKRLFEYINNGIQIRAVYPNFIKDLRVFNDKLVLATEGEVFVYNPEDFSTIAEVVNTTEFNTKYSCAILDGTNSLYIGTNGNTNTGKPGFGILKTTIDDTSLIEEIHPDSPLLNSFFKIKTLGGHIYGTHGGYDVTYNPYAISNKKGGISHYFDDSWQNIPFDSIQPLAAYPWSLSHISIHPFNPNLAYISSSVGGVVEIENNQVIEVYDGEDSTLIPFSGLNHFVHASTFDQDGTLWVMNGRYESPLNRFKDGQWTSYSFLDIIDPATSNNGFSSIIFDSNNNVFIGTHRFGLIGFNENGGNYTFKNIVEEEEGMPSPSVKCLEIDRNGQLWIGTGKGLRIVYNTDEFINGTPEVDNIVVLDDGVASELLYQQYITDIEVDGSNNKWIASLDTGLYYFSSDGQETIFHFTKDNSPLPSNVILDVDIDDVNGVIYIATEKGMVSFNSDASKPQDNLENAYVYPNPVRPNFDILTDKVKIRDISDNVNIKITDIEGNLVAEAESRTNSRFKGYNLEIDGGTALWNGKNMGGNIVASGVYLIMLNDLDTFETRVLKVMVVR
ncbi:two-component regulator propeller domain-containing protein [Olleya sp. R77988]|uniref:type IX secretion system anionic LPS delivery protein PorZ n=1 Tax=Olleya sp. R77988 TaxID=3093875 RepID=UPI0037C82400